MRRRSLPPARRPRAPSSPSRITTPPAASATRSAKRSRLRGWPSAGSRSARCRAAASPTSCWIATASPPGTSSTPSRSQPEAAACSRIAAGAAASRYGLALTLAAQAPPPRGRARARLVAGRPPPRLLLSRSHLVSAPDGRSGKRCGPTRPTSSAIRRGRPTAGRSSSRPTPARASTSSSLPASGGAATAPDDARRRRALAVLDGDGRIVFSHRAGGRWRLYVVDAAGGEPKPLFTDTAGRRRAAGAGFAGRQAHRLRLRSRERRRRRDLWVAELVARPARSRRTRGWRASAASKASRRGRPDSTRLAFFAVREGTGGVWVVGVPDVLGPRPPRPRLRATCSRAAPAATSPRCWCRATAAPRRGRPTASASRSPTCRRPIPTYNGNPERNNDEPPPLFAGRRLPLVDWSMRRCRSTPARARSRPPRPGQSAARRPSIACGRRCGASTTRPDRRPRAWQELKAKYRPQAQAAQDEAALETAIDAMVAEQPLIKPLVVSDRAVVVSGHPLASRAGALALEQGGNIVDAAIAVSFALGVVEPEASGIGGDGMAVLYLKGMTEPVAIDYKDQVPIRATRDNPLLAAEHRRRRVGGEHPGRRGRARPALPQLRQQEDPVGRPRRAGDRDTPRTATSSTRRCRRRLRKAGGSSRSTRSSARIYLPGGKVPQAGERFVNKDYAATLRAIRARTAPTLSIAARSRGRIADDMARNGGLITLDDLAQYRAIERRPLAGRYRDHQVYSAPPPVSTGVDADRDAADPGELPAEGRRAYATRRRLPALRDRVLEGARSGADGSPTRRCGTSASGPHLDPAHAADAVQAIDPKKASRDRAGADRPTTPPERIGRGTTAFAVADADGNMIAVTQTLSTWGGTFYVSDGPRLSLQQPPALRRRRAGPLPAARRARRRRACRRWCSRRRVGTGARHAAAGGRGGRQRWIPASVYDIILNVVDGGMDAQRAIEAPRFLVGRDPADPARQPDADRGSHSARRSSRT